MEKRTLTIVIDLDHDNPPDWIWESHKSACMLNGVFVKAICDGDRIKDGEEF